MNIETIATMEPETNTRQILSLDTKDGKRFLRKVIRDNEQASWNQGWIIRARREDGWRLSFDRTIAGKVGQPDLNVSVVTDYRIPSRGKWGAHSSFSDDKPVTIHEPNYLTATTHRTNSMAFFIAEGWRLELCTNRGSTNSSRHGIGFIELQAYKNHYLAPVTIDQTTVINGQVVCSGIFHR
jgi:hypothetical protein